MHGGEEPQHLEVPARRGHLQQTVCGHGYEARWQGTHASRRGSCSSGTSPWLWQDDFYESRRVLPEMCKFSLPQEQATPIRELEN